jgi:cell division septum initiation protein DivIVA
LTSSGSPCRSAAWAIAAGAVLGTAGCVDPQQVEGFRSQVSEVRDRLQAESRAWEERLAQLEPESALAADTRAALARVRAQHAAADAAVQNVDMLLTRATHPSSPIAQGVNDLSPWLPPPLQLPLALGAALVLSLARAAQLKRGISSIAQGFEKALEEDPAFADRFRAHANTFRTIQTPAAKRAVDEATGHTLVRLPI